MDSGSKVQFSDREALLYHEYGRPGKIEIIASKPMATQRDLSLAYSPGVAVPVLAIAGSLGKKKVVPTSTRTLATHTPLFIGLLCAVVLIVGALTFIPALALGPIVEHLQMAGIR